MVEKIDENYMQKRIQDSRKNWYIYFYDDKRQKYAGIIGENDYRKAYLKLFEKYSLYLRQLMLRHEFVDRGMRKGFEKLKAQSNEIYEEIWLQIIQSIKGDPFEIYRELSEEAKKAVILIGSATDEEEQNMLNDSKIDFIQKLINNKNEISWQKQYYPDVFIKKY